MAALESIGPARESVVNKIKCSLKAQLARCAAITRNNKDVLIIA